MESILLFLGALSALHAQPLAVRDQVARRWAPTIYQESLDPLKDHIAALDFDGDWDATNNAEHLTRFPLRAVVYYAVAETPTHWFVQYLPYHPVDYKLTNGHEHDTESILLVVAKRGGPLGTPEVMETRFHTVWYQYAAPGAPVGTGADDIDGPLHLDADGRPMVYSQRVGHGLCGGFAPNVVFPDLQLTCDHARRPELERKGVVYRYTGEAGVADPTQTKQEVGYALVDLASTWWIRVHEPETFARFTDFAGERCSERGWHCPSHIGRALAGPGESAATPWGQSPGRGVGVVGDTFFDPAFTMAKRLTWKEPFSIDYAFNPYVGIEHPSPAVAHATRARAIRPAATR